MSYCLNPKCHDRRNPDDARICQSCETPLLIQNRYRLLRPLRELDEWEPAEVFEIDDHGTRRVMKVLKKVMLLSLFQREVETLQRLDHPGIPKVEPDGYFTVALPGAVEVHCLVMEKIAGTDLDAWLANHGPITQAEAEDWLKQLLELLALIHQAEIFHRDIKLSNIMRRETGQLMLIDFGTVRQVTNTYLAKIAGKRDVTSVVSPGYTPLEQMNGKAVPQSDFYALGRSIVALLTGKHPIDFTEDEEGRLIWQSEVKTSITQAFAQLLDEMMAPFPGQRPLSAEVILNRLAFPLPPPVPPSTEPPERRAIQWLLIANILVFALQLLIGGQWLQARQRSSVRPQSATLNLVMPELPERPRRVQLPL
ncbi:serine/threonine protein kinase [filamentous cyanobacterium LEGE 11480]|uniref:non-specific serine/threonine protein kinase n=1 Tax=Romeriopsis navalis LEGE 11480 TaxID=2777977 RepID=A0A928VQE5_9CYAN|nr:serine/threonine-protein kinase [Romeriopsis navalis]MBE9032766.1 serine/threonine protein kinase [Romeriopsis navalis LEGE 11480]